MFEQEMQSMWIYVYVKFSKRESSSEEWYCEWCQLLDPSAFVLKQAPDWIVENVSRRGRHSLIWPIQVCAAKHKVLSIKQDIEFYY